MNWKKAVLPAIIIVSAILLALPWMFNLNVSDKINATMAVATAEAVFTALLFQRLESFLDSPSIFLEFNNGLIEKKANFWIRGRAINRGTRTAHGCRARLAEIQTGAETLKPDITNGYLQWQGGEKGLISLNPGEARVFDFGVRYLDTFELISYVGEKSINQKLAFEPHTLTFQIFGDDFPPYTQRIRINIGNKPADITIEPA